MTDEETLAEIVRHTIGSWRAIGQPVVSARQRSDRQNEAFCPRSSARECCAEMMEMRRRVLAA